MKVRAQLGRVDRSASTVEMRGFAAVCDLPDRAPKSCDNAMAMVNRVSEVFATRGVDMNVGVTTTDGPRARLRARSSS
ncbi:hypothetical protein ACWPKO_29935 (plasmid) [Coraliomargarita sp. W4R53]